MDAILTTLLITNIVVAAATRKVIVEELKKVNDRLDKETLDIKGKLSKNTTELNLVKEALADEIKNSKYDIKNEIKGEIKEQIIKLAFTPIKLNLK